METRVVVVKEANQVILEKYDIAPGPKEVLVKTHMASICGTDKNYSQGKIPREVLVERVDGNNEEHRDYPLKMGHEGSGTVIAVGEGVSEFKPGDKVISFGWYNTMADYFVAPVKHNGYGVVPVPDGMTLDEAALGEPAACAIYAGMRSGVELGDNVLIVGAGFAGQVIAQVVKKMGAKQVIVADLIDGKLALAKKLGADEVMNPSKEDIPSRIMELTGNQGVDVAIEVAGNDAAIQLCTDCLKHGGILGLYSWVLEPVNLFINRWHNDGFDIRTLALMHRIKEDRLWWISKAMRIVADKMVDIESLISHVYPIEEAAKAFDTACNDPDACKVMICP